jgi:hypothetical protein
MGFAECAEDLLRSARGDDEPVGPGSAEDVERTTDIVIRMQDGRWQTDDGSDRPPIASILEDERMRLGHMDQPLISSFVANSDNDIGAAKRIGFAEARTD